MDSHNNCFVIDGELVYRICLADTGLCMSMPCVCVNDSMSTATGVGSVWAGSSKAGFIDGVGGVARFRGPRGMCVLPNDDIYVADQNNNRIRIIVPYGPFRLPTVSVKFV